MSRRAFTVEEANALIPELENAMDEIEKRKASLLATFDRIQILDLLWGKKVRDASNPDFDEARSLRKAMEADFAEIDRLVRERIVARGMRFPEGALEHGLVDFPTTYDGRWVYLCWHRGEQHVAAWHEADQGFASRHALTADQVRRMGREDDPSLLDDSVLDS
jgi:hypothetical protein